MCTPKHAQLQQIGYFKSPQEIATIINLRMAGHSYDKAAELYAKEYPDGGRPDGSTVRRFFTNHADVIDAELKKIKPGIALAYVRGRLALLQGLIYETAEVYRKKIGTATIEELADLSKILDKLTKALNEMAVQCGDVLVSQSPQGQLSEGDRPQIFQTVFVEKAINQTLVLCNAEAEKQGPTKAVSGELLPSEPAVSDPDGSVSPA